jgi:hypothetical protein
VGGSETGKEKVEVFSGKCYIHFISRNAA